MTSFGFLLASWLMPLHFPPWVSWHNELLAFVSAGLLGWRLCVPWLKRRPPASMAIPGAGMLFLGLGVVVMLQATTGLITFRGDAIVLELYLALCVIALMAGFAWGQDKQALQDSPTKPPLPDLLAGMAWTLVAGSVASSIIALVQVFEVWDNAEWIVRLAAARRPGANLGQPNQLATLLLMGMASLLYLRECNKLSISAALLGFVLLSTGLAATESRTGLLSFICLCTWWFAGRARTGLKTAPWTVAAAMAGFFSLFLAWPTLMSSSGTFGPGAQVDAGAGMRLVVWPQLLEAVALRPWWGWGLREVAEAHNAVASSYSSSEPFTYSHNVVIDLAVGLGLPLAAFFVSLTGIWLWRRVRSARSLPAWYCLAAVLPLAVHSMLEFPFAYAYFLVPALFLVGVLEATAGARPVLRIPTKLLAAGLLFLTIGGAWSVGEYLLIEEDFRVARFEALRLGRTPTEYERPKVHLLTQLDALLHGARIVPHLGMSADELELARTVALRFPWPATQNRYALSLALNGNPGEALRQLLVLRALHGQRTYLQIKANWEVLANTKYPALKRLTLP